MSASFRSAVAERAEDALSVPMQIELTSTLLGEGASGKVWLAHAKGSSCSEAAAKVCCKRGLDDDMLHWLKEEIEIHKAMRHPHVCTLHERTEDELSITIILSLCRGGSLCDTLIACLDSGTNLRPERCHTIFLQLIGALEYLHRHGIVHRDIKLDNLCWRDREEKHLLLIDFGHASRREYHSSYAGSAHYAAPEVHRAEGNAAGTAPFSCALADVWSAGVCLFTLLATQLPFNGEEETRAEQAALRDKVCRGVWDSEPPCDELATDLLRCMLKVDTSERSTLAEVIEHDWVGGMSAVPWQGLDEDTWQVVAL